MPETINFDPADFDRRLNALMEITASQSASIHELAEAVKEQGRQINEQGRQLKTTERLVREMVDRIKRLEGKTISSRTPE